MSYLINFLGGKKRYPDGNLFSTITNTSVAATTTETALVTVPLPASFFIVGRSIEFVIRGFHSSAAGNLTFRARYGGVSGTIISATDAFSVGTHTDRGWVVRGIITCRSTGASGTVFSQGEYHELISNETRPMEAIAAVTINTTTANDLVFTAQFSSNNAGNSHTVTNSIIRAMDAAST